MNDERKIKSMNDEQTEESLIAAFSDDKFNKLINEKRIVISKILSEFTDKSEHKISKSINSRIKSVNSLKEKLKRKNYISKWNIHSNVKPNALQSIICQNLPDLLGFRINCYFKNDEEAVFEDLKKFLEANRDIIIEKDHNHKQKNGHNIYKMACKYQEMDNIFCFEVQVKSLIHDTWGEVEHSIVYKSKKFDFCSKLKEDIIEGLYSVLEGSDKQLQKLYTFSFTKEEIERQLFYIYTSTNEMDKNDSMHYSNFFSLDTFLNDFNQNVEKFLGQKLLKSQITKTSIRSIDDKDNIFDQIKDKIDAYKWDEACKIAAHMYDFSDNDVFLKHIINGVLNIIGEEDLEDSFNDDSVSKQSENDENTIKNILASLEKFLNEEIDNNGKN